MMSVLLAASPGALPGPAPSMKSRPAVRSSRTGDGYGSIVVPVVCRPSSIVGSGLRSTVSIVKARVRMFTFTPLSP